MPRWISLALLLSATVCVTGQQAKDQPGATLTDPRALIDAAAKYYDFNSAELKPWHLKASYKLYDLKGNATAEGKWEYWWASPKMSRSTWTRAGSEHTEWESEDGTTYSKESGEPLRHFERAIAQDLIWPFPAKGLVDPDRMKLDLKMLPAGSGQLACVGASAQWTLDGKPQAPSPMPSYYCFDSATLALRMTNSNSVTTEFDRIVKTQGRYLGEDITISFGKVKAFSVSVEKIDGIASSDAALTPAPDAVSAHRVIPEHSADAHGAEVKAGSLVKKSPPSYPATAKAARIQGTVVLAGIIGKDGKVRDIEVLASPDKLLSDSAVDSVKRWEYQPYLLNGEPVEVETTINVVYAISP